MRAKNGKGAKAAVVGGTGYGGAELIRLLLAHPEVSLARVASVREESSDYLGKPLEAVHKNLTATGLRFEQAPLSIVGKGVDVVFLGLPHKVSSTLAPEIDGLDAKVIDLSGDYRLRDSQQYEKYYGVEHPHPEQLDGRWQLGLPELYRARIREAKRVASPGCFATSVMLSLLPLAKAGLLRGPVQTLAATGSSGSGATAKEGTHHPLRTNNMKVYKPLTHQHVPEIEQVLRDAGQIFGKPADFSLFFVPLSAPIVRGILANCFVRVDASVSAERIDEIYRDFYAGCPLVRPRGSGAQAEVVAVKGSIWTDISWTLSEPDGGERQLFVSTAIDNLVKGGAGQAVQSMNLMLGLPEGVGIDAPALWP
jgi:N-acetyl-gamma-glutamyl-phosphate reductase